MSNLYESIKDIALLHQNVNSFGSGDIFKLNDMKDIQYPMIWIELQTSDLNYTQINPTIRIYYVDRTLDDLSDSMQIELDSIQVLNDLIYSISNYYQILDKTTVTPFNQKFFDMCAGGYIDIQLSECADGLGITNNIEASTPNLLPSEYVEYSGQTLKSHLDNLSGVYITSVNVDNVTIEGDGTVDNPLSVTNNIKLVEPLEITGDTTLSLSNLYKGLRVNSSSNVNIYIPTSGTVNFEIGTVITIQQVGTGSVVINAVGGVTLLGNVNSAGQYKFLQIWKSNTDEWNVIGGVE